MSQASEISGHGRRLGARISATALLVLLPSPAYAGVYWANQTGTSIGRAAGDGTTVNQAFIVGASAPRAVAIDGAHVYWINGGASGSVGRANADGSAVNQALIPIPGAPGGIAVDNAGVYWSHAVGGIGSVGRARLDGSNPNQSFVPTGASPCGVAVDADKVYWANGGDPGSIGRSHGAFTPNQAFISPTHDACSVAVTDSYIYWANRAGSTLGRANLDGTGADQSFIRTSTPCGVAVDGQHIYWSTGLDSIGRANLDGTGVDERFITGAHGPCGVAVDPTLKTTPASFAFRRTEVSASSSIEAFFVANTSSSPLRVSSIRMTGANRGDFVKTGDGCVVNVVPAGGGCVFNIRFAPKAPGTRGATIIVDSNASSSPTAIPISGLARDTVAPTFLRAAVVPAAFEVGPGTGTGTTFRYILDEAGRVVVTILKESPGKLVGGRCARPTPPNRHDPRCIRLTRLGRFSRISTLGINQQWFSGHLGSRILQPGSYRAVLIATDAAGNVSRPRVLRFRVRNHRRRR